MKDERARWWRERVGWVEDWSPYGIYAESNVQIRYHYLCYTAIDYFRRCGAFVHCYMVSVTQWYACNLLTRIILNFVAMVQAIFPPYFECTVYVSVSSSHWPLYYLCVKINEWQRQIPSNYSYFMIYIM